MNYNLIITNFQISIKIFKNFNCFLGLDNKFNSLIILKKKLINYTESNNL